MYCLAVLPACAAAEGKRLTLSAVHTLPYGGQVRPIVAEQAARTLARLDVLRQATPTLVAHKVVRLGLDTPALRLGLGSAVLTPLLTASTDHTAATVTVRSTVFIPTAQLPEAVRQAMGTPEALELRAAALSEADRLVREVRELLTRTRELRTRQGMGADAPFIARLDYLTNRLTMLDRYEVLLTRFGSDWQPPDAAAEELEAALRLDPDNALVRLALSQTMLRLDRPHDAVSAATEAVRIYLEKGIDQGLKHGLEQGLERVEPRAQGMERTQERHFELAAAYMARGMAQLRVGLSALAETDFSRALALRQDKAGWWRARGAARFVQQDEVGLCADLYQACGLGDCTSLSEMRERGLCTPVISAP